MEPEEVMVEELLRFVAWLLLSVLFWMSWDRQE